MGMTDWVGLATRTARDAFVAAHPYRFLVWAPPVASVSPGKTVAMRALTSFPTFPEETLRAVIPSPAVPAAAFVDRSAGRQVQAIHKRTAVFRDIVTVGRTANNDIVLSHSMVSKFHAWFRTQEDGALVLVDAGSRNGTTLDGRRLTPKVPVEVSSGAVVRFGTVECTIHDAATLHALLRP